jgi:hypothetical protein
MPIPIKLREDRVLWIINRVIFHPRGFALGLDTKTGELSLFGDGEVPWRFDNHTVEEDLLFDAFEGLLDRVRADYRDNNEKELDRIISDSS